MSFQRGTRDRVVGSRKTVVIVPSVLLPSLVSYSLLRKSVAIERKNKSVACLAPLVFGNATHARHRGLTSECRFAEPRLMLLLQFVAVSGYEMPAVHCTGGGWVRSVSYVCLSVQPALLRCHPADRRHREFVKW